MSPEFTGNRIRSSLAGANAGMLHTFLGTQIPCLLKMVEGNRARYFELIPMLMDRVDIWMQNSPSEHCLLYCYPHLKTGLHVDLENAVIDGFASILDQTFMEKQSQYLII